MPTGSRALHANGSTAVIGASPVEIEKYYVKPNIMQMDSSYIIMDYAGGCLKSLHNMLASNGYGLKVLNLEDMWHSDRYNPIAYIGYGGSVEGIANCILENTDAGEARIVGASGAEKALLMAMLTYVSSICDGETANLPTVLMMAKQGYCEDRALGLIRNRPKAEMSEEERQAAMDEERRQRAKEDAKEMFSISSIGSPLDELFAGISKIESDTFNWTDGKTVKVPRVVPVGTDRERHGLQDRITQSGCMNYFRAFKTYGTSVQQEAAASLAVRLAAFGMPETKSLTMHDSLCLYEAGSRPMCIFIILPESSTGISKLLAALAASQAAAVLRGREGQGRHVRIMLNGLGGVGTVPGLADEIAAASHHNMSFMLGLQTVGQADNAVGLRYGKGKDLIAACGIFLMLGTNDPGTALEADMRLFGMNAPTTDGLPRSSMELTYADCIVKIGADGPFMDTKFRMENHPMFNGTGNADPRNTYDIAADPAYSYMPN